MAASKNINQLVTKDDMTLLFETVTGLYGVDQAQKILEEYGDNLWGKNGLAFIIGRQSLPFFCQYFLQDTFRPKADNAARKLAPVHFEVWGALEDMFVADSYDKLELVMPRGSSKTTTCDFALTVWAHCYKLSVYTLICGKTEQDAVEFVRNVRTALEENPYINAAFGKLIDPKNKRFVCNSLELELTNHTKVQAISSKSSMRGKKFGNHRPSLIIADDYQGKNDILTQEARDRKYNTWVEDCQYAGDTAVFRDGVKVKQATKLIVLGTLMHRDCFMSRLLRDNSYHHIIKRVMDIDDVDAYFNSGLWGQFREILYNPKDSFAKDTAKEFYFAHMGDMRFETLWPDKYDCLDLALNFYYPNPTSFKQEYQNDISKIGEKAFHTIKHIPAAEIEANEFERTILVCDPAVETGKQNDYTALCVAGKTSNGFRWIRKGEINRYSFDAYVNRVIELLEQYEDISVIWVEKNTYNGADVREMQKRIEAHNELKWRNIEIINERQLKNKEAKIRAIGGKVDNGYIIFNDDDEAFYSQVLAYEGEGYTLHDDAPDVVAEADRLFDTIRNKMPALKVYDLSMLGL